ncbi:hypothetical protein [Kitasatospora purpeofusca]|uniref:hypothetical protein n=1 Tax=Kitasatospora purpeofusca TaxID=67352 RepID=UPI0012FEE90C|nr:hypothetical protein [Kitasatospora purpeofusca]
MGLLVGFALGCLVTAATLWRLTLSAARKAAGSAARAEAAALSAARSDAAPVTTVAATPAAAPVPATAPAVAVAKPAVAEAVVVVVAKPNAAKHTTAKPTPRVEAAGPAPTPPRPRSTTDSAPAPVLPPAEDGLPRLRPASGPSDKRGPVPRRQAGERFHFSGRCGEREAEYEFPIEWPEGAITVAQIEVSTKGYLSIRPMTRTLDRVESHSSLIYLSSSDKRKGVRTVLTHDFTHLLVDSRGIGEWSVRLYGSDEIDELTGTVEGYGSTVLAVRQNLPVSCVIHVKSSSWSAEFICACGRIPESFGRCGCPIPPGVPSSPPLGAWESGEAMRTLLFPRAGVLKVRTSEPSDPWRLEVRPYAGKPKTR